MVKDQRRNLGTEDSRLRRNLERKNLVEQIQKAEHRAEDSDVEDKREKGGAWAICLASLSAQSANV